MKPARVSVLPAGKIGMPKTVDAGIPEVLF
jgi:hypothetical protein